MNAPLLARLRKPAIVLLAAGCALPSVSAGAALAAGALATLLLGTPWPERTREAAHRLLALSVVGLGAGMDLRVVARVGLHGLGYTAIGITVALGLGTLLGRLFRSGRDVSLLISVGTAICGGSAIAAVAPSIRAKGEDTSLALAAVFLFNAVALFIFPAIGRALHLSQGAFGLWAALAIHDTSSVVGAAAEYGPHALQVATATKLARALWIVPVTFGVGLVWARREADDAAPGAKPRLPWFIAGFIAIAALVTFAPALRPLGGLVALGAQRLLAVTLFLIGLGISRKALRELGPAPLLQAAALWLVLGSATLLCIVRGWIG